MWIVVAMVRYYVRAKLTMTAGHQPRTGKNVQRTTGPSGLPLAHRLSEGLGMTWPHLELDLD